MSDPYAAAPLADDIVDAEDTTSSRLDQAADALLEGPEDPALAAPPLRDAVRQDLREGGEWVRRRAELTRESIQDSPLRTAAYAVGVGVLIGLLLRR